MIEYRPIDSYDFDTMNRLREEHKEAEERYFDGIKSFHGKEITKEELAELFKLERQAHKAKCEFFDANFGCQDT